MDVDVGLRLRSLRGARGLTQRELAKRAGVTNGMISMIEQNHSSPSVASLKRILDAVPISFAEFFSTDTCASDKVFFRSDELHELDAAALFGLRGDTAALVSLRQVGDGSRSGLQLMHEVYAPGADTGLSQAETGGEAAGLVIEGSLEVTVGDDSGRLHAGDAYRFDSALPHRFRNPGPRRSIVVRALVPASH